MNFYQQTELQNWKNLSDEEKKEVFRQVLLYFVNPLLEVRKVKLKDFVLCGMRCRTFELEIGGETFVFVPGQNDTILGWDNGCEGLKTQDLFDFSDDPSTRMTFFEATLSAEELAIFKQDEEQKEADYDLTDFEDSCQYVNDYTTELRKVDLPACLVSKRAIPAGTLLKGEFDIITGAFDGDEAFYKLHEKALQELLLPQLTLSESLRWNAPENYLAENQFYFEMIPGADKYRLYRHQSVTYAGLRLELDKQGFDLPDADLWEYLVGGGTRRLFRWGHELALDPSRGDNAYALSQLENMFGLLVDNVAGSFELTNQPEIVKMGPRIFSNIPLESILPFSTYYRNRMVLPAGEVLAPENYLFRKVIRIEP